MVLVVYRKSNQNQQKLFRFYSFHLYAVQLVGCTLRERVLLLFRSTVQDQTPHRTEMCNVEVKSSKTLKWKLSCYNHLTLNTSDLFQKVQAKLMLCKNYCWGAVTHILAIFTSNYSIHVYFTYQATAWLQSVVAKKKGQQNSFPAILSAEEQ